MRIEQLLKDRGMSIYELAERSGLSYSVVHNIMSGKSELRKCTVDTARRLARALRITIEDLLLLCDRDYTFTWFRSEQCHLVHRKGELDYLIDVLETKEIDRYWRLSMYAEALYELAMVDYISRRNDLPKCENYNEMRKHKLDRVSYPIDAVLVDRMRNNNEETKRLEAGAIPEFRRFNIVEGEIFDDDRPELEN